jgi:uncharacterized protein YegL
MAGEAIAQLNAGLQQFIHEVNQDPTASARVEVAVVTFGPVELVQPFVPIDQCNLGTLVANGSTPLGAAISTALDAVDARKQLYKQSGIPYYRPWVFVVSDGAPDRDDDWQTVAQRIKAEEQKNGVSFFAVGVDNADMAVLNQLSSRPALRLKGYSFAEMFLWLSGSMQSVSQATVGKKVTIAQPTWGQI